MEVSLPIEPVYYYECSAGAFRITYFMPPEELRSLIEATAIRPRVLEDYPDGVDLDCTEPDFADFERRYGYRPEVDPQALQSAFFALLSSTRNWRRFRGTGFLPKGDLEKLVEPVVGELDREGLLVEPPVSEPSEPSEPSHRERRRRTVAEVQRETRRKRALEKMDIREVDSGKDMRQQSFSRIRRSAGRSAAEIFDALHRTRKGE